MRVARPLILKRRYTSAEFTERMDLLSPRLLETTTPVYTVDTSRIPSSWGSAILLEVGHIRFAVSAAHVFDRRHSADLYIHGSDAIVPLLGTFTRLSREGSRPDNDPIDITFVRLHETTANAIDGKAFVRWDEIDHEGRGPSRDHFLLLGFAETKMRDALHGNELRAPATRFGAKECPIDAYSSLGHDVRSSLLLGFDKKRMWDEKSQVTAPSPNGMSGSGIWRAGPHVMTATASPKLTAIFIEWHRRSLPKHILATRIHPVLGAIAAEHDDAARVMRLLA